MIVKTLVREKGEKTMKERVCPKCGEPKGLYLKYIIAKADGSPVDPNADYFVLRLDTDQAARGAARNYANRIMGDNPLLAQEIRDRADKHSREAILKDPTLKEIFPIDWNERR